MEVFDCKMTKYNNPYRDNSLYSLTFFQVSVVTEMFLDLSLPVSDEVKRMFSLDHELIFVLEMVSLACLCVCDNLLQAYRKKNPKKVFPRTSESSQDERNGSDLISRNDDSTTGASSKYQQKKAKKQAKKQAKVFH